MTPKSKLFRLRWAMMGPSCGWRRSVNYFDDGHDAPPHLGCSASLLCNFSLYRTHLRSLVWFRCSGALLGARGRSWAHLRALERSWSLLGALHPPTRPPIHPPTHPQFATTISINPATLSLVIDYNNSLGGPHSWIVRFRPHVGRIIRSNSFRWHGYLIRRRVPAVLAIEFQHDRVEGWRGWGRHEDRVFTSEECAHAYDAYAHDYAYCLCSCRMSMLMPVHMRMQCCQVHVSLPRTRPPHNTAGPSQQLRNRSFGTR